MTVWPHIRAAALAFWAGLAIAAPAGAQLIQVDPAPATGPAGSAIEIAPEAPTAIDPEERGRRVAGAAGQAAAGADTRLAPMRPESRLVENLTTPRLTGEVTVEPFVLILPADPGAAELRLSHRSSIDVLPEESALRIVVNGRDLGTLVPDNFAGFEEESIRVPEGVLRAGRNLIEIEARHTHRVACGPDASFAVWTEIDTSGSGVAVPADAFGPDAAGFVSALAAQAAQGQPIPIRRSAPRQPLGDAAPFLAELAAILGGTPPEIETVAYWTLAPEAPPMARITAVPPEAGLLAPRVARGGDGALVLLVEEGSDWSELRGFLSTAFQPPSDGGLRPLRPGEAVPLSALVPGRLAAEGRYDVVSVPFRLPQDWLMLTSAKAELDLDYRFAAGLPEGSLLLVKANDVTIQMLPLDAGDGSALPTLGITFPARLLHPGANRIDFEVLVPGDPVDRACPALSEPVVEVSPASRLNVPRTPRMSLPSIDLALARLAVDGVATTGRAAGVFEPGIVPQVAAALAHADRAAVRPGEDVTLTIATLADLETIDAASFGGALTALTEALSRARVTDADRLVTAATAWDVVDGEGTDGLMPATGVAGMAQRVVAELRRLTLGAEQPLEDWLAERMATAALLQPDPERPGDIWLVLGPQADPAAIARVLAASRDAADGPNGQLAIYSEEDGWSSWASPDLRLELHEAITLRNLRDIMGTYATLEPLHFMGATLLLTALSIIAAVGFIIVTRGRP